MDWTRLFADAVDYAAGGLPVSPRVARDWARQEDKLKGNAGASKHLLFDGAAPVAGQRIGFPALGKTLEKIAAHGAEAIYHGEIAEEIASTLQGLGGVMTEADLADCQADWVDPISTSFRSHEVFEIPPNGQGITALIMLNLIEALASDHQPGSAAHLHEMIEIARIAYAMRDAHVADSDHLETRVADILSSATTEKLLGQFNPAERNPAITLPQIPSSDTVYLSIVDRDGRAVSFINSIFSDFGSGIVTEESGIALQNRANGFCLEPGHPNAIAGGKRPMHTIIPAMAMQNGKPSICFGVMGGQFQAMGQAHVLVNMLKYGMDPQEALDFQRVFWDEEGMILAESPMPNDVYDALTAMGHPMARDGLHGGGQIIRIDRENGTLIAGSDPRKDGHAAGY